MNLEQCRIAARDMDEKFLAGLLVQRSEDGRGLAHARWMIQDLCSEGFSENKAMRWLGYVQGVLVTTGMATLEEMKKVSMQAVDPIHQEAKKRVANGDATTIDYQHNKLYVYDATTQTFDEVALQTDDARKLLERFVNALDIYRAGWNYSELSDIRQLAQTALKDKAK